MTVWRPTRRAVARLLGLLGTQAAARGVAAQVLPDRGIGGTGAVASPTNDDRGIGGTGVVGTIRRFGSIVVNDMRIGYPANVAVTIDGRPAALADLRLGHVVHLAAASRADGLSTEAIAVRREVVGRIERRHATGLVVLGQEVELMGIAGADRWRTGQRVAVCGLRAPDGKILASLVEQDGVGIDRVTGTLVLDRSGPPRIGHLPIAQVDAALVGKRALVIGRRRHGVMVPAMVLSEIALFEALKTSRLSLEALVQRRGQRLRGDGLDMDHMDGAVALASLSERQVVLAVLAATIGPDRAMVVESVRLQGQGGSSFGRSRGPGGRDGARSGIGPGGPRGRGRPGGPPR